jgi:CRP-like cAMP-binding protein
MALKKLVETAPATIKKEFKYRTYRKGASIILPGVKNEYLYILINGTAEVYRQNYSGAVFTLHRNEPYSCFGEMELFNRDVKTHSIIAISDCKVILVHKRVVYSWMKSDFSFNLYLINQLVSKLVSSSETSARLSFLSVKERILLSIHTHYRIGDLGTFTKKNLLAETCVPIRSLNRSLAECLIEGFVGYTNKKFFVISPEKLEISLEEFLSE